MVGLRCMARGSLLKVDLWVILDGVNPSACRGYGILPCGAGMVCVKTRKPGSSGGIATNWPAHGCATRDIRCSGSCESPGRGGRQRAGCHRFDWGRAVGQEGTGFLFWCQRVCWAECVSSGPSSTPLGDSAHPGRPWRHGCAPSRLWHKTVRPRRPEVELCVFRVGVSLCQCVWKFGAAAGVFVVWWAVFCERRDA